MKDKKLEEKLQKQADNIEVTDFDFVWNDVKAKVAPPQKKSPPYWLPLVASMAAVIVLCLIIVPIILKSGNHVADGSNPSDSSDRSYFSGDLLLLETTKEEYRNLLNSAGITIVDVDDDLISSVCLFKTSEQLIKGGLLELTDDPDEATFFISVTFYDESVEINNIPDRTYDFEYTVNNAVIQYSVKEYYPEDGVYIYDIKTTFNDIKYIMEYTCFTEDIRPFLSNFFK